TPAESITTKPIRKPVVATMPTVRIPVIPAARPAQPVTPIAVATPTQVSTNDDWKSVMSNNNIPTPVATKPTPPPIRANPVNSEINNSGLKKGSKLPAWAVVEQPSFLTGKEP